MRRRRLPKAKICPHCKTSMLRYSDRCVECGWTPWLKEENTRYLLIAGILTVCAMIYLVFGMDGRRQGSILDGSSSSKSDSSRELAPYRGRDMSQ